MLPGNNFHSHLGFVMSVLAVCSQNSQRGPTFALRPSRGDICRMDKSRKIKKNEKPSHLGFLRSSQGGENSTEHFHKLIIESIECIVLCVTILRTLMRLLSFKETPRSWESRPHVAWKQLPHLRGTFTSFTPSTDRPWMAFGCWTWSMKESIE